ncbi:MAG: DUF3014 domain-containing protein [Deltaproteobacteria bacterium]|nr:MAG: DUF3014 domain-containing protein [Deltaproteobacteria bacterium]
MKLERFALLLLVILLAFYAGWYLYDTMDLGEEPIVAHAPTPSATPPKGEPENPPPQSARIPMPPRHPVSLPEKTETAGQPEEPPLPQNLEEADGWLQQRLSQLGLKKRLLRLLRLEHFIGRMVIFIDQLPERSLPRQHMPVVPPDPPFMVTEADGHTIISSANGLRYRPYVNLFNQLPVEVWVNIYQSLYPLFQQAWEQTGESGYFNDRLVEVIDHLLKTPVPRGPVPVQKHITRYRYVDAALENASAGQKLLIRSGQIEVLLPKLKQIRNLLAGSN